MTEYCVSPHYMYMHQIKSVFGCFYIAVRSSVDHTVHSTVSGRCIMGRYANTGT